MVGKQKELQDRQMFFGHTHEQQHDSNDEKLDTLTELELSERCLLDGARGKVVVVVVVVIVMRY